VGQNPNQCPADAEKIAEAYSMGTLNMADAAAFEEHYFACLRCLAAVEDMEPFVRRMRVAARRVAAARAAAADR